MKHGYCQLCRLEVATITVTDDNPDHRARICSVCRDGRDWVTYEAMVNAGSLVFTEDPPSKVRKALARDEWMTAVSS